jgi:hypothetical protein
MKVGLKAPEIRARVTVAKQKSGQNATTHDYNYLIV